MGVTVDRTFTRGIPEGREGQSEEVRTNTRFWWRFYLMKMILGIDP